MAVNAEQNQQYNQQQQNTNTTGGGPAQTQAAPAAAQGRTANYSTGVQTNAPTTRFTNLQKYIGANEGAGDRLAQGIEKNVGQQNAGAEKDANTSASAVRQGIQSAQGQLNTGNQYLNQVNDNNFNANDIAQDQNKLQDFTNYRTGQAIDQNALNTANTTAQTNNINYQNQLQNQLTQSQSDQGRYNLLKNAFGGGTVYQNPYSTGQQRLDQLFLQSGGTNGINNLQNNLRTNLGQVGQQLNSLTGQATTDINNIGTQAGDLATNLQNATSGLTNGFVNNINSTQDAVNAQRLADQNWATQQYQNLQNGGQIDQRFANLLGLNSGENLYNSLVGKNAQDVLNYGSTTLQGADQLANSQQRAYYDSLAKLSGVDPNQYAIHAGGDPAAAVANANTINGLLQTGQNTFNTNTADKNYNYTWGGGAIVPVTSGTTAQAAASAIGNLSSAGADKLRSLGSSGVGNLGSNGILGINDLLNTGFNQADANTLMNAMAGMNSNSSTSYLANGINNSRLGALYDAAGLLNSEGLFNHVNIAPPTDTESGGQFGVT